MSGMTVTELKELLEELEGEGHGNTPVYFQYNYGDHWRTQVAEQVTAADPGKVEHSEYHRMMKVVDEYSDAAMNHPNDPKHKDAILLS